MKNLLSKIALSLLEKVEQALLASVVMHEMGLSPLESNYFIPIVYPGLWETQYFNSLISTKLPETAELPSSL